MHCFDIRSADVRKAEGNPITEKVVRDEESTP
jgi:hypothetical protein